MNRRTMTLLCLPMAAALLAGRPFPALPFAPSPAAAAPAPAADEKEEKKVKDLDTELAKQMETIDDSMKKLRRTLRKADSNKESLELIDKVEKASTKCKDLVPAKAAKVPEGERAKWVENY